MAAPVSVSALALNSWEGGYLVGGRRIVDRLFFAEITSTGGTTFGLLNPVASGKTRRATASGLQPASSPTIDHSETGDFQVLSYQFRVPAATDFSALVATNGNRLKVASAVTVTTANGAAASSVAASTTFAQQSVQSTLPFGGAQTDFAVKTGDVTISLFSENGSNAAGSTISAASATIYIPVVVTVAFLDVNLCPQTSEVSGAFLRELEE
ncbi:MAG: hypothetical protein ACO3YZ_06525 [Candidatus Nanopelagicaceae bacterium]